MNGGRGFKGGGGRKGDEAKVTRKFFCIVAGRHMSSAFLNREWLHRTDWSSTEVCPWRGVVPMVLPVDDTFALEGKYF